MPIVYNEWCLWLADDTSIRDLKVSDATSDYLTISWISTPHTENCQPRFKVNLFHKHNVLLLSSHTNERNFTWKGRVCTLKSATVQVENTQRLIGIPTNISLQQTFSSKINFYSMKHLLGKKSKFVHWSSL